MEKRIAALQDLKTDKDINGNTQPLFSIAIVDSNNAGNTNVAINGILNEPDRALVLAIGHLRNEREGQSLYLSYNDTQGAIADLINAGIDKYTGATSNPSTQLAQALWLAAKEGETQLPVYLYAHSGGTLISDVALNTLGNNGQVIAGIHTDYFGPAASISSAAEAAINAAGLSSATLQEKMNWLKYGDVNGLPQKIVEEGEKAIIQYTKSNHGAGYYNHGNDPVATFVGANFGLTNQLDGTNLIGQISGSEARNILQSIMEIYALFTTSNSAHSTYRWNDPRTWPTQQISLTNQSDIQVAGAH